jgi:hypothetical protein
MSSLRRTALAVSVFSTLTSLLFFLTGVVSLPLPMYLPLGRRWTLSPAGPDAVIVMDYFGRSLFALSVAALLTLGIMLGLSVLHKGQRRQIASQTLWLWLLYSVSAFVLCSSLFAYKLYGRETTPLELPPQPVTSPASPDEQ